MYTNRNQKNQGMDKEVPLPIGLSVIAIILSIVFLAVVNVDFYMQKIPPQIDKTIMNIIVLIEGLVVGVGITLVWFKVITPKQRIMTIIVIVFAVVFLVTLSPIASVIKGDPIVWDVYVIAHLVFGTTLSIALLRLYLEYKLNKKNK
jgi:hypothetical protein